MNSSLQTLALPESLLLLPLEMICYITRFLDIQDITRFSRVNREIHDIISSISEYRIVMTTIRSHHIRNINRIRKRRRLSAYFHMPGRVINQAIDTLNKNIFPEFNKKVIDFYVSRLSSGVTLRFQNKNYLSDLCVNLIKNNILDSAKTILDSGLLSKKEYEELTSLYREYKWANEALVFFI